MIQAQRADVLIVGGGLAGIVTALQLLRGGQRVMLVDRDHPKHFGGLAYWAFGGMALVDTPLQRRMKISDSPELALGDWLRFGELDPTDHWSRAWAEHYVAHSRVGVYDWLKTEGIGFMPAVNWVERGRFGDGNSVPRYHIVWGTARELIHRLGGALHSAGDRRGGASPLTLLHRHRVTELVQHNGRISGAWAINEDSGERIELQADQVVLAMGGVNGSHAQCRKHWPAHRPQPTQMLNGAHPNADGQLHAHSQRHLGARLINAGEMWNYAAGITHARPLFDGHGLSTIPCKSALWLDHRGQRIGPEPLVTGFDTHWLCQRVAEQAQPWTWHLLNWRIAIKEFAISGAEHNPRIRNKQFLRFIKDTLLGQTDLIRRMQTESDDVLVADDLHRLAEQMNALTRAPHVDPKTLQATVDAFDANFASPGACNDAQIRMIEHARQWRPDRLRTCKPAPLSQPGAGPYIAMRLQLITRKSLGGLRTNLDSRVLDGDHQPIPGLYCVGEAAGFGGGGAHGKRSLEGTFLPGCILTAQAAARAILSGG
jgi:predicted oxidoreductase